MQTRVHSCARLRTTTDAGRSPPFLSLPCPSIIRPSRDVGASYVPLGVRRSPVPFVHSIASIDYKHPFVLSGSSDKHIRLLDVSTLQGWSTSPSAESKAPVAAGLGRSVVCEACGSNTSAGEPVQPPLRRRPHEDLVRSVALSSDLVVSGSYDFTVKVSPRARSTLPERSQRSSRAHHMRARALCRCGIVRRARPSPTWRAATPDGYSASASIARR